MLVCLAIAAESIMSEIVGSDQTVQFCRLVCGCASLIVVLIQ